MNLCPSSAFPSTDAATSALRGCPVVTRRVHLLQEEANLFVDTTWAESAKVGDKVDYLAPSSEKWTVAEVVAVSPTFTELQVRVHVSPVLAVVMIIFV